MKKDTMLDLTDYHFQSEKDGIEAVKRFVTSTTTCKEDVREIGDYMRKIAKETYNPSTKNK